MKMYCPTCQKLYDDIDKCPKCLFSKLREPRQEDPVPLTKLDYLRADMLGALLDDAQIPYLTKGGIASAFGKTTGMRLDVKHIFVPYGALERAKELLMVIENGQGEYVADDEQSPDDDTDA